MPLPILPLITGLVNIVPAIAGMIGGNDAEEKANKIAEVAKTITGIQDTSGAIDAIKADPNLAFKLQEAVLNFRVVELQEETKRLQTVNATMQAETKIGDPWSAKWRPFWGFTSAVAFVLAIIGIIVLAAYAISTGKSDLLKEIPSLIFQLAALFSIPGAILGVASWHRGQMQRITAGKP